MRVLVEVSWKRLRGYSMYTGVYECPICGACGTAHEENGEPSFGPPTCKHFVVPVRARVRK